MCNKESSEKDLGTELASSRASPNGGAPFLWIDVSGDKGRKQPNSTDKRSHVLRNFHHKTRHELEEPEIGPRGPHPVIMTFRLANKRSRKRRRNRKSGDGDNADTNDQKLQVSDLVDRTAVEALRPRSTGSPWQMAGEHFDPFDSTGIGLDPHIAEHLDYCKFCTVVMILLTSKETIGQELIVR